MAPHPITAVTRYPSTGEMCHHADGQSNESQNEDYPHQNISHMLQWPSCRQSFGIKLCGQCDTHDIMPDIAEEKETGI